MRIRQLMADDGPRLREIRLRALEDAPWAFDVPYAEDAELPAEEWARRASQSEVAEEGIVFVAEEADELVGMAGGFLPEPGRPIAIVWGMWVDPSARATGIGGSLLDSVVDWVASIGVTELRLSVSIDDRAAAASRLYRRRGFIDTGERGRLRADPSIELAEHSLSL